MEQVKLQKSVLEAMSDLDHITIKIEEEAYIAACDLFFSSPSCCLFPPPPTPARSETLAQAQAPPPFPPSPPPLVGGFGVGGGGVGVWGLWGWGSLMGGVGGVWVGYCCYKIIL